MSGSERWAIGLDIGGTNARAALVRITDSDAETVESKRKSVRQDLSPMGVAELVADLVTALWSLVPHSARSPLPVGIGLAAQMSSDGRTVLNAPNLGWLNEPFSSRVEDAINRDVRVRVANDLSAIVWGETSVGAARGYQDVLAVYVGTGVGSGIVLGGSLFEGSGGVAGEIGHIKLRGVTAECGCGQTGCVEAIAGGRALERRAERLRTLDKDLASLWQHDAKLGASSIENAVETGIKSAQAVWDDVAEGLADAIGGALALFNPAALILGGGVLMNCPLLRGRLLKALPARTVAVAWNGVEALEPRLGDDAGLLGAALLAAQSQS